MTHPLISSEHSGRAKHVEICSLVAETVSWLGQEQANHFGTLTDLCLTRAHVKYYHPHVARALKAARAAIGSGIGHSFSAFRSGQTVQVILTVQKRQAYEVSEHENRRQCFRRTQESSAVRVGS